MKISYITFEKILPIIFLLLGIFGVYLGSFEWLLSLIFLASILGIYSSELTFKETLIFGSKGMSSFRIMILGFLGSGLDVSEKMQHRNKMMTYLAHFIFYLIWAIVYLIPLGKYSIWLFVSIVSYYSIKNIWGNQKYLRKISENSSSTKSHL